MTDAGIHEGDTLVVDRSIEARDGLVVVAVVGGEMTVKRLRLRAGRPMLMAESGGARPLPVGPGGFEVWGVVTYCIRPLA